jgi:hypothetical protein
MKKTLNQITALSDEVWYHLDIQHPIFLLSIFLCISRVGAKTALGGKNPESDDEQGIRGRPGPYKRFSAHLAGWIFVCRRTDQMA